MPGKIILLRHGESEWNQDNLFCGWCDIKLTPKGETQAKDSAKLIDDCNCKPDIVFTSKLTRSIQTANIILSELDLLYLDLIKNWRLNERHYGSLQGVNKNQVLQEVGKEKYMFWRRAYNGCPPPIAIDNKFSGLQDYEKRYCNTNEATAEFDFNLSLEDLPKCESLEMVLERLLVLYKSKIEIELKLNKTVLIVTHGSVVRALVKHLYNISDESISSVNIPNGIPILIELDDNLSPITKDFQYLDPQKAKVEAEKVRQQGFIHSSL